MHLQDKVIIVTGGAHGIGRALCRRFANEQPRGLIVADIDFESAHAVANESHGVAVKCDVSLEQDVKNLIEQAQSTFGSVDLFCANAGIAMSGGAELTNDEWQQALQVNFLSHLYAVRALIPSMLERGSGYFLHTASAAGLLTELSSAPYSVTKHAVIALAEWVAITYGKQGIGVSCLCPQGVKTRMLQGDHPVVDMLHETALEPQQVADCVVEGLASEHFLILPHPEVAEYFQRKAGDYDRWLGGMRKLRTRLKLDSTTAD